MYMDLDEALLECERLRALVERLEEENDRLRSYERASRAAGVTPSEVASLNTWARRDDHNPNTVYSWSRRDDFPAPLVVNGRSGVYELDTLRTWKRAFDAHKVAEADRKARAVAERRANAPWWSKEGRHRHMEEVMKAK